MADIITLTLSMVHKDWCLAYTLLSYYEILSAVVLVPTFGYFALTGLVFRWKLAEYHLQQQVIWLFWFINGHFSYIHMVHNTDMNESLVCLECDSIYRQFKLSLQQHRHIQTIVVICLYAVILLAAISGNLLSLLVLLNRHYRRCSTDYFLINMASSDLLGMSLCQQHYLQ